MAPNTTTAAEQFKNLSEREQDDLKHDAWDAAIQEFREDHPDWYGELDESNKVSWEKMGLEVYQDENGRDYFHIVTGTTGGPGEPAKRRSELAVEFMNVYRDELTAAIKDE